MNVSMNSAITTSHVARAPRVIALVGLAVALSGCGGLTRLASVGAEPPLTQIENPVSRPDYRPVSMPMPAPRPIERNANSLWRTGARAFFKDQRAGEIGDILTVVVDLDDQAQINNATTRARTATEDASLNALLGYETSLGAVLPEAINPGNLLDADSATNSRILRRSRTDFRPPAAPLRAAGARHHLPVLGGVGSIPSNGRRAR